MIDDICCRLFSAGWSFVIFVLFSLFFFSFFHRIDELGAAPLRDGIFIISSHLFYFIGFFSPLLLPSFLPSFQLKQKKNGFFLVVVVDCVMILRLKKFLILLFKYILNSVSVDGWKGRPWAPSPVECSFHRWFDSICGCGGGRTDGSTGCISTCIWFILRRRRRPDRWQHRLHFHLNRIFLSASVMKSSCLFNANLIFRFSKADFNIFKW